MTRPAREGRSIMFPIMLTVAERADIEARAGYRGISAAEYVRQSVAACAEVGGPEEFVQRSKKGKKK